MAMQRGAAPAHVRNRRGSTNTTKEDINKALKPFGYQIVYSGYLPEYGELVYSFLPTLDGIEPPKVHSFRVWCIGDVTPEESIKTLKYLYRLEGRTLHRKRPKWTEGI